MSLRFLTPVVPAGTGAGPVARSPMEHAARRAGAEFELRDGWNVAVAYPARSGPAARCEWADVSHLGKLELQGSAEDLAGIVARVSGTPLAPLGSAVRTAGSWWCPATPERVMVVTGPADAAPLAERLEQAAAGAAGLVTVTDLSSVLAGLTIVGPDARELIARFCALDLRPRVTPPASFRPGSVARTPGYVLCEAPDRYLVLFGWAVGHYLWTVVADAGEHLGGHAVGVDALRELEAEIGEGSTHA